MGEKVDGSKLYATKGNHRVTDVQINDSQAGFLAEARNPASKAERTKHEGGA
jgi:hypothetical protein